MDPNILAAPTLRRIKVREQKELQAFYREHVRRRGEGSPTRGAIIDALGNASDEYHAFHATRAELLRRMDRRAESRLADERAITLAGNTAETTYLTGRRDALG